MKNYTSAPLPFQGQKRRFISAFREVLKSNKSPIYVDLFGGSGLLSHNARIIHPGSKVVYNDYDNYKQRLDAIPGTNALLADLRALLVGIAAHAKLDANKRAEVLSRVQNEPGYVDYITLSSSLLFTMNYVKTYDELCKATLYNNVKSGNYDAEGYLDGVEIICNDYRTVYEQYKHEPGVVFLIDPPYLSTDCQSYESYWKLKDYLDVLLCLNDCSYMYFTSNKSNIVELCEWIQCNTGGFNPFQGATTQTMSVKPSYTSTYTDMMIYKYI